MTSTFLEVLHRYTHTFARRLPLHLLLMLQSLPLAPAKSKVCTPSIEKHRKPSIQGFEVSSHGKSVPKL